MKQIRRRIITEIAGSPQKQKAVAFALLLKDKTKDSSVIRDFTIYKVQKLTADKKGNGGMAYRTIRKYLDMLLKMGLTELNDGDLYIKKMASSSKHRNVNIEKFKIDKTKNVFNQLRELLFLVVQAHKDFVNSLLRLRKNPEWDTDFKKVRRLCKKCCGNPNADYRETGLSYNRIARQIGCCARTAFTLVKDAVKRRWCVKHNHCEMVRMDGVNFRHIPGYAFTTMNYGFILRTNTYTLTHSWADALGSDAAPSVRVTAPK